MCGILGTLAGGFILDYISNSISNGFKVGVTFFNSICSRVSFEPFSFITSGIGSCEYKSSVASFFFPSFGFFVCAIIHY